MTTERQPRKGNQLPRSLHTVRVLRLLAEQTCNGFASTPTIEAAVLKAAVLCGYPDATKSDPLVQLAVQETKRHAERGRALK